MATVALNRWPFANVEGPHTFFPPTPWFARALSPKAPVQMSFDTPGCGVSYFLLELEIRAICGIIIFINGLDMLLHWEMLLQIMAGL